MIDLTRKALPNTVMVGGRAYSIYTDFRVWMRFEIEVGKMRKATDSIDVGYLFMNEKPLYSNLNELFVFSRPRNELPRPIDSSHVIAYDFEIDSDLIYAAFLGQYGIDLVDIKELHWHKFLALLNGINDSTKLREVIGYRCYEESSDKESNIYSKLRSAWEIIPTDDKENAELERFNSLFEKK